MFQLRMYTREYNELLSLLKSYIQSGKSAVSQRKDKWNEAEKNRKAYINLKAVDEARKVDANKGKAGYPGIAPIVVPITFAMNMTTLSYLITIFASRTPIIPILGGGDDSDGARKMEAVLTYQMSYIGYLLKLYLWFQDVLDYGVGVTYNFWKTEEHNVIVDLNQMGMAGMINRMVKATGASGLPTRKATMKMTGFEGNDCEVIDPYNLIIDPRFPLSNYKKGDFFGFSSTITMSELKDMADKGKIVNFDKVVATSPLASTSNNSMRDRAMKVSTGQVTMGPGVTNLHKLFVKLEPFKHKLGDSSSNELWEFWVAGNDVIVYGEKVSNVSEEFPTSIIEYNPDGHSLFNLGQSELLSGLQGHLSWLFNSHMDNVRKSLNDMLIVDPSRVNMKDLLDPEPGKIIRISEIAQGQDVRSIVHQLQVQDVTSGHLQKASIVIDFMQRVSAATDNMMGLPNFGRRTATEIRNIQVMAGGRMKMFAEVSHVQGLMPQHRQFISNTQQYLSQSKAYRILGESGDLSKVAQVNPGDILGMFDIPPADGTLPTDRLALADTWKEVFNMMLTSPAAPMLVQKFNIVGIFENIAQLLGAKDLNRFLNVQPGTNMQPGMMDGGQIDAGVQQGDIVPLSEMLGQMGGSMDGMVNQMVEQQYRGA